jgi:glycine cleavage system H protein
MNYPENLKYTAEHEWIRFEGDVAFIGITDFAQSELGDIVYVDIETKGQSLKTEDVFGTVEAVKTVSDLFMPVSGEVLEVNPAVDQSPEKINQTPYDLWIIRVKMSDPSEADQLLSADAYKKLIGV